MKKTDGLYRVQIDPENNGDLFWAGVFPPELDELNHMKYDDIILLTKEQVELLKDVPGWNDGDERAPHPLIIT
jgi:hypothetical protein